jgi:pimeloyl-ACP methyl ester carboxylesterase
MVTLAGLSLGGAIALNFAIKHPERVSSMLLMSTFHKVDGESIVIFKKLKNSLEKGFIEFFDEIIPMVLCPKAIEDNMEALNLIKEEASKTANITAYISAIDVCLNQDVEDKLKDITIPTLIFAGKYDEISPLKIQEDLNNKLNNSEIIIFDNVKHNILIGENIDKISNIVKEFI